jgi:type 1 fimbria pilin
MMMPGGLFHSDGGSAGDKSARTMARMASGHARGAQPAAGPCRSLAVKRLGGLLSILLLLILMPWGARADCTFDKAGQNSGQPFYYTPSPVYYSLASSITVPFNLAIGAILGSPVDALPANPPDVSCTSNVPYGVQNLVGSSNTSGGTNYIYPTAVPGLGYQLIHDDNPSQFMSPYPDNSSGPSFRHGHFDIGTTLQLVQTGPIANGSVLQAGTLSNWQWGSIAPEYFVLQNSITFVAPACVVNTTNIAVVLPTVTTSAFPGKDSTSGTTPSSIQLTCPSGATSQLSIMFAAQNGTPAGYNNVLTNTGSATGLGVEMIYNGSSVVFGSPIFVGTTPAGGLSIPFSARYHATAATVGAGSVNAAATFTLSYQ